MFETVLVANRGEIASRIIRTVQRMGLRAVAVHSEADAGLPYVRQADESVGIGPAAPAQSYRDADALLEAARQTGARAVHPGYGFLAENASFARRVRDAGLVWVGPGPEAIEAMGDKIRARNLVSAAGVPVSRGHHRAGGRRGRGGRCGARHRLPGDGQGVGRRRRDGHGRRHRRRVVAHRARTGPRVRRADVRRPSSARRAVLPAGAARRGAGVRSGRRPGGGAR